MTTEKTFVAPQIIPPIFSRTLKGCSMFPRFFLNRVCFKDEIEIDAEDYLMVEKTEVNEKKFFVYTNSAMELTSEQEEKKDETEKNGCIWWGEFVEDLTKYGGSSGYGYCECENVRRSDFICKYKVKASTLEKYFSIIYLFCEIAICKCQLRYWMEEGLKYFFKEDNILYVKK